MGIGICDRGEMGVGVDWDLMGILLRIGIWGIAFPFPFPFPVTDDR
jgi:hypothetical protein